MTTIIKKINFLLVFTITLLSTQLIAQVKVDQNSNVGVGTSNIETKAKLEVHSENKGFLKPRMDSTKRKAILNPPVGLEVYDTDFKVTFWYDGTKWQRHGAGTGGTIVNGGTGINVTGNGTSIDPYIVNATTSNPTSETINNLITLLHSDEVPSSEHKAATVESDTLKEYYLAANTYSKIIIEAVVKSRMDADVVRRPKFIWKIYSGSTLIDTFIHKIVAMNTTGVDGGGTYTSTLSTIINGGQTSTTKLYIRVIMDYSNTNCGALVESFRVYAVGNEVIEGVVGPPGPPGPTGPQGPQGSGGVTVGGAYISVTGVGTSGDPFVVSSTHVDMDSVVGNELQTITTNNLPGNITLSNGGGTLNLNVQDADANPTNELQTLSLNGQQLTISPSGNTITLPATSPSPTDLSFSGVSSPFTLNSSSGNDVTITAGNNISLSTSASNLTINGNFTEQDADPLNEIQTIGADPLIPGRVTLSKNGGFATINVKDDDFDPDNENQDLVLNGQILSITNGNSVTLPEAALQGSGTENYLARWTPDDETLGTSLVYDDGTTVAIGTESPNSSVRFHISGQFGLTGLKGNGTTQLRKNEEKENSSAIVSNQFVSTNNIAETKNTKNSNELNSSNGSNKDQSLIEAQRQRINDLEQREKIKEKQIQDLLNRIQSLEQKMRN